MSNKDMSNLIHVGFTNKYQLDYAKEQEGAFYCDSDNECYIPLYMLKAHAMRAIDSVVVETHDALTARVAKLEALLKEEVKVSEFLRKTIDTHSTNQDKRLEYLNDLFSKIDKQAVINAGKDKS
jgi:hypothetical protein